MVCYSTVENLIQFRKKFSVKQKKIFRKQLYLHRQKLHVWSMHFGSRTEYENVRDPASRKWKHIDQMCARIWAGLHKN